MGGPAGDTGPGEGSERFAAYKDKYESTLRQHVDEPAELGLLAAAELGRLARDVDLSMLQVVGMHLEVRRAIVVEQGIDRLADMDAFLSATLASFDQRDSDAESPRTADRDRLDWLRGLSDAYIAIASGPTLAERLAEVCEQTRRFLAAADARLEFGRAAVDSERVDGDEIAAHLLGSAGLLTVTAQPGHRWTEAERNALQQLAALISAPINDARRLELSQRAGRLGWLLGGVVFPDEVLARFQGAVRDIVADRVVIRLAGDEPETDAAVSSPVGETMDEVARTGDAVFLERPTAAHDEIWAVLPLRSGDTILGVLAVGYDEPQAFDEVQRSFLSDIAQRLSAAIERSRAYANERRAREEAELASARLGDLQSLATDLARAATRRRVAQVLLRRAVVSSGAAAGLVALYTTHPDAEVLAANGVFRTDSWDDIATLVGALVPDPGHRIRGPIPMVEPGALPQPIAGRLRADGIAELTWHPITSGERDIGIMVIAWSESVPSREVDRSLLEAQVAMAGSTLRRAARYDVEHAIADTLQRSLLSLPNLSREGLRWSVLYRAGSAGLAGGDWYDLIEIDDDRIAVVVGDIVGRGVEAAASMGQLRSATRALASRVDSPAELLAELDRFTVNTTQGRYSSLAYVVVDMARRELTYSVAGHPPPVLRHPDGSTATLDDGRGPLLGMPCVRTGAAMPFAPGARLVMYSDGLVERRGESVDVGIVRLVGAVGEVTNELHPDEVCRQLVDALLPAADGAAEARDDVALVVLDVTD
jgi:hypothetical protein